MAVGVATAGIQLYHSKGPLDQAAILGAVTAGLYAAIGAVSQTVEPMFGRKDPKAGGQG